MYFDDLTDIDKTRWPPFLPCLAPLSLSMMPDRRHLARLTLKSAVSVSRAAIPPGGIIRVGLGGLEEWNEEKTRTQDSAARERESERPQVRQE
jgi:hypothetical protein